MMDLMGLYRLAEDNDIAVDCFELKKREALSVMDSDGTCYIAIDPFKLASELDEKMKLGHELGHSVTGSFYNEYATCDVRRKHENRADKWAINEFVSEQELDEAIADGHTEMWDLADYFHVTEDFMKKAVCWYTHGNLATELYFWWCIGVEPFKVPFFKRSREKLAMDIFLDAELYANAANKARSISAFIENYDLLLDAFKKLSAMNGRISNLKGNLTAEYWKFESEFQKHLHDAIARSAEEIVDEHKGVYKYDNPHVKSRIIQYKKDVVEYEHRCSVENKEFAWAQFRFLCHECNTLELLRQDQIQLNPDVPNGYGLGEDQIQSIIDAEKKWQMDQQGIGIVDSMEGHDFEYWCADLLRKNGYENVEVTPGSGDQGIDVLAEKDGIKYAIQCKCYSKDLGNTPVQEAEAGRVFYGCHVGVVMTNRYFTKGAKELAKKTRTILWDRDRLEEMLEKQ